MAERRSHASGASLHRCDEVANLLEEDRRALQRLLEITYAGAFASMNLRDCGGGSIAETISMTACAGHFCLSARHFDRRRSLAQGPTQCTGLKAAGPSGTSVAHDPTVPMPVAQLAFGLVHALHRCPSVRSSAGSCLAARVAGYHGSTVPAELIADGARSAESGCPLRRP